MRLHAELMCSPNLMTGIEWAETDEGDVTEQKQQKETKEATGPGDVLNIGFGLGLIDGYVQGLKPRSHTIVEAHPDVYKHMIDLGLALSRLCCTHEKNILH